jgi:hypothetical protein
MQKEAADAGLEASGRPLLEGGRSWREIYASVRRARSHPHCGRLRGGSPSGITSLSRPHFGTSNARDLRFIKNRYAGTCHAAGARVSVERRSAMTFGRLQVQPGMEVVGTAGTPIGRVKENRLEDFLVDRPSAPSVYVPYEAIRAMLGDQVVLQVTADAVDSQGWLIATEQSDG